MMQRDRALTHARAVMHDAAASIAVLRASLQAKDAGMTRQQLLIGRDVLHEMEIKHDRIAQHYTDMTAGAGDDLAKRWQGFLSGYDKFLDAARRGRPDLVREEVHPCTASEPDRGGN